MTAGTETTRKTGILTTHRANNYGAMLQSYALAHVINNRLGHKAEIVDYRSRSLEKLYHWPVRWGKNLKTFLALLHHRFLRDRSTYKAFARFRQQMLPISQETYYTTRELQKANSRYSAFIAGSDQIWNPRITTGKVATFDQSFLLDFVEKGKRKCSYASSIGILEICDELAAIYKKRLSDFTILSLREHEGARYLSSLLSKEAHAVCDPVLLMTADDWKEVENPVPLPQKDYVLVYSVGGGKELMNYAKDLARSKNCALYTIQPPVVGKVCSEKGLALRGVGPAEFVWLIRNAKALVTTSFHGSAFGLNFQKESHILLADAKQATQANSRLDSLFTYFGVTPHRKPFPDCPSRELCIVQPSSSNMQQMDEVRAHSMEILKQIVSY